MSKTLDLVRALVSQGKVRISEHGYDELAADGILAGEVIVGLADAVLVENYPDYPKGPCVLVLEKGAQHRHIHAVRGIPRGKAEPAVLITAYRPDPELWENGFLRRKR